MSKRLLLPTIIIAVAAVLLPTRVARCAEGNAAVINDLFRAYQEKLPEPQNLSEDNGVSLSCPRHGWVTYTLLRGLGNRMPLDNDSDLPTVIPWCRSEDPCIRQIALDCVISRIGYDNNSLSVPDMHERDHYEFYDVLVAAKAFLDNKHIKCDANVFSNMLLDVSAANFGTLFNGTWIQDGKYNFLDTLEVRDGRTLTLTTKAMFNPPWPERIWKGILSEVRTNEHRQFVLRGDWDATPAAFSATTSFPYNVRIWLVTKDVLWLSKYDSDYWRKFRKSK